MHEKAPAEQVLIAETDSFVAMWKDLKLPDGRDRVVRQGHGPHRDGHLDAHVVAVKCAITAVQGLDFDS